MPGSAVGRLAIAGLAATSVAGLALTSAATTQATPPADHSVTGPGNYVSVVAGYSDAVLRRCAVDHRQQNEPSLAIDPADGNYVAAGANDYCTLPTTGDSWQGIYRSVDGGKSFQLSLIPGYPGDKSSAGKASPLSGLVSTIGDPWNAWDGRGGFLYAMGSGFNPLLPQNGSVWVATFDRKGQRYVGTVLLAKGVPATAGPLHDKTALTVDNSGGAAQGTVYAAWSRFQGAGNNEIDVAVSRDHGLTFTKPVKVSAAIADSQFPDLTVAPNGTAYLVWRIFAGRDEPSDAVVFVRSTDGGRTWSMPRTIAAFQPYDKADVYVSPSGAAEAIQDVPDSVDDADATSTEAGDCGDGGLACQSGYTFYRDASQTRVASDRSGIYVVWNQLQNAHPTGTTYSPGGYSRVAISRSPDGVLWSAPALVDQSEAAGDQTFPTVAADGARVTVGWNDSRGDACFSQERPAGNCSGGSAPAGGSIDTYVAHLSSGTLAALGGSQRVSSQTQNPNYRQFAGRLVPFFGDYITVAAAGGRILIDWTDNRNVVAATSGDGNDVAGDPQAGGACTSAFTTCFDRTRGLDQDTFIAPGG